MRFLRFTLLQAYFSSIQKNKKKALLFINVGIFLSIFAFSSAAISFFIEKKISDIQNDLTSTQIETRSDNTVIAGMENQLNALSKLIDKESYQTARQRLVDEFEILNKIFSAKDYYGPYIYYNLYELEYEIEQMKELYNINMFDKNDPYYVDTLIPLIKDAWNKDDAEGFVTSLDQMDYYIKEILKINIKDYIFQDPLSIDEIISEIKNENLSSLNVNSKILDDYTVAWNSFEAMKEFYFYFLEVLKGFKGQNEENILNYEKDILYYSNLERNVILVTFIFQFAIFSIIQIFEINSVNFNFKKKVK